MKTLVISDIHYKKHAYRGVRVQDLEVATRDSGLPQIGSVAELV